MLTLLPFLRTTLQENKDLDNISLDALQEDQKKALELYSSQLIEIILDSSRDFPVYVYCVFEIDM
jgi:hypothetical protein